jgi:hypothetical protein
MRRKEFGARAGVCLVVVIAMTLAGCSTAWIGQVEEIVAALIPAAANIVTLVATLQGKAVSAADLQTIENAGTQAGAGLQLIQSLIAAYQKADAATQPEILNQIESAIRAVQTNLQGLLPALHIQDAATQAKVTAVIGIVLSEVQSLAAIVPLVKSQGAGGSGQGSGSAALPKKSVPASAGKLPLSASEFVSSYNAKMTAKTGNAELDKTTANLKIHSHGGFARFVSLGAAK